MTKQEIKALVKQAISQQELCRVFFKYESNYWYFYPLAASDRLFLGAEEDDFILDGYSIRRFRDVVKVEIKDDKCVEINRAEGVLDQLKTPGVDITDWKTAFLSLQKMGKNIIVEKENLQEEDSEFAIGRIVRVLSKAVLFQIFDANGVWEDGWWTIPFSGITSVTFGSRYVEVFSKYLPPIPLDEQK